MSRPLTRTFTENKVSLERRYLTKTIKLEHSYDKCFGCGTCTEICPKEALTLSPATHEDGALILLPRIKMDPEKCVLCGTCVVFCPSHALQMTKDDEKEIPVIEYVVMPQPVRSIDVDFEKCNIDCELVCKESCPVKCIDVKVVDGKIESVDIAEDTCFYCKQCEAACPYHLIKVQNPFEGIHEIDTTKCPEGCAVCRDACPSHALTINQDGLPEVDDEFCILCSACEKVCPEEAIKITRTTVHCSDTKSGAWFNALEKLTSPEVKALEIAKNASKNRKKVVREAFPNLY